MVNATDPGVETVDVPEAVLTASQFAPGATAAVQFTVVAVSTTTSNEPAGFPSAPPAAIWNSWPAGTTARTLPLEYTSVTGTVADPADVAMVIELRYRPGFRPDALATTMASVGGPGMRVAGTPVTVR